ncbi:MAG TPA: hypothetical protein VED18_11045 [Candidatus Sulfotelmatobacter sp.]|nr:hypothetical protein [Candidatus Sulfotelmatobacter sp.]
MKKRPYTPPAVSRVDLVSHEVALQVCKTNTATTNPSGKSKPCNAAGNNCKAINSPS